MPRTKSSLVEQKLPEWAGALGRQLRELRRERNLSLAAVSEQTGVSTSFLSLLEQGRTDVSLGRLLPLLDFYGRDLSDVMTSRPDPSDQVVRSASRRIAFSPAEGIEAFLASSGQHRAFMPLVVEFASGSAMDDWSSHDVDEFLIVLDGELQVDFADAESVILQEEDSMVIASRQAHRLAPTVGRSARALIVTENHSHR